MAEFKKMLILELITILLILGIVIVYLLTNGSSLDSVSFITGR
jgi:hypothetical protein